MEFRLTYDGKLLSTRGPVTQDQALAGKRETRWEHKHDIRQRFHQQLKRLWEIHPALREWSGAAHDPDQHQPPTELERLRAKYAQSGFDWVPLVTPELKLNCHLDILYLRNGARGDVLSSADIDNRMKTLIDALKIPGLGEIDKSVTPAADQKPFFVLLSSDALVTKLTVEADMLLEATDAKLQDVDSRVVVTVRIWPYSGTWGNLALGF